MHNFRDIGQNSVIMGFKIQIWPPRRHLLNRTENKWAYMNINGPPKLSLCTKFERNPVGVVRVTAPSVFTSKMAGRNRCPRKYGRT